MGTVPTLIMQDLKSSLGDGMIELLGYFYFGNVLWVSGSAVSSSPSRPVAFECPSHCLRTRYFLCVRLVVLVCWLYLGYWWLICTCTCTWVPCVGVDMCLIVLTVRGQALLRFGFNWLFLWSGWSLGGWTSRLVITVRTPLGELPFEMATQRNFSQRLSLR